MKQLLFVLQPTLETIRCEHLTLLRGGPKTVIQKSNEIVIVMEYYLKSLHIILHIVMKWMKPVAAWKVENLSETIWSGDSNVDCGI